MSKKNLFALVAFGLVLVFVGSFITGKIGKHGGQKRTAQVEVVQAIEPTFDANAQAQLAGHDPNVSVHVFFTPINVKSGMGNANPFGH